MELLNLDEASEPSGPSDWLYASRRLDLLTLPAGRALDVVLFGSTPFYRITPPVLDWFERAGVVLRSRNPPADQLAVFDAAMGEVLAYCQMQYREDEMDDARARGPRPLPEPEWCPDLTRLERAAGPQVYRSNPSGSASVQLLKAA